MRGKAGTKVRLTLDRDGKAREVTLTRRMLEFPQVRTVVTRQPGGGYRDVDEMELDGKWQKQGETLYTPEE
jgi:C-terminal processing protease CtpA/Prc